MTSHGATDYLAGVTLYKGAEADVVKGKWQGLDAVFKVRRPLTYRLPVLDEAIRRQRTLHEAEMIHQAKEAGVASPNLYHVDPRAATLVMEFVEGERVRDLVDVFSRAELDQTFFQFGRYAATLHRAGIMHGDLTTANVVKRRGDLVFVDFGLSIHSTRLEDHAVDLRLIKETIVGAHSAVATPALDALLRGYASQVGPGRFRSVLKQLRSIERRGRYARVA